MTFLELKTPRDMLDKTKREHARLSVDFNVDNVFNFFVTAYHIRDYIEKTKAVDRTIIKNFCDDQDIKDSRDLCDKAKHFFLTHRPNPQTHRWSGAFGATPFNVTPFNSPGDWELLSKDGRVINIKSLAERVLYKWNIFFEQHGL